MTKMKKTIAGIAALAALALGGAVFAQAQGGSQPQVQSSQGTGESVNGPDGDTIQSGDQTTPDASDQGATDASDQGGTDAPDQTGSESGSQSDGPGGHADPAGNVDNQFEGQQ